MTVPGCAVKEMPLALGCHFKDVAAELGISVSSMAGIEHSLRVKAETD